MVIVKSPYKWILKKPEIESESLEISGEGTTDEQEEFRLSATEEVVVGKEAKQLVGVTKNGVEPILKENVVDYVCEGCLEGCGTCVANTDGACFTCKHYKGDF